MYGFQDYLIFGKIYSHVTIKHILCKHILSKDYEVELFDGIQGRRERKRVTESQK
jgi:hypothetical protein